MVLIYHDFYRRKHLFLGHFRFSCTKFDDHLKSQSFKTASPGCVCTSNIEHFRKFEPKSDGHKESLIP